jgi:hypothetical protein
MFGYDEEATIQDADIEMALYAEEARHGAALRRSGVCTHNSSLGTGNGGGPLQGGAYYPEQIGMPEGSVLCTETNGCGKLFATQGDYDDACENVWR